MYNLKCLPDKLRQARQYRKLNQSELSELFNMHPNSYSKWERGTAEPNATQLARLANFEQLDIAYYFDPKLKPENADFKKMKDTKSVENLSRQIDDLKDYITKSKEYDHISYLVRSSPGLREFVLKLMSLDKSVRQRLLDRLNGFIQGIMEEIETEIEEGQETTIPFYGQIAAGKPIFLEKPISPDLASADEMLYACEKNNVKMSIAVQNRVSPANHIAKQIIDSGQIGKILSMRGRGKEDHRGGGEDLMVLGFHIFDLMRFYAVVKSVHGFDLVTGNEAVGFPSVVSIGFLHGTSIM